MISVIIPTLNEEYALPGTLASLFNQSGDFEVIVADGGSTDQTLVIAASDKRIQVIHSNKGRASQMNAGAAIARGEWLLFLHADTLLPVGALKALNDLENISTIQAGGFRHKFSGTGWELKFISWLHNFRCRITKIFYGDQAMFVRSQLFVNLGGYPDVPILEDVLFGEKLIRYVSPTFLPYHVTTDSRKFEKAGIWLSLYRVLLILVCHETGLSIPKKFFENVR